MSEKRRELASDKLADVANLGVGALAFGQALAGSISWPLAIAGVLMWVGLFGLALFIREEKPWAR